MDNILTYPQAAAKLGISVRQLRYYINKRHIPYIEFGERKRLIKESELDKFLNHNTYRAK